MAGVGEALGAVTMVTPERRVRSSSTSRRQRYGAAGRLCLCTDLNSDFKRYSPNMLPRVVNGRKVTLPRGSCAGGLLTTESGEGGSNERKGRSKSFSTRTGTASQTESWVHTGRAHNLHVSDLGQGQNYGRLSSIVRASPTHAMSGNFIKPLEMDCTLIARRNGGSVNCCATIHAAPACRPNQELRQTGTVSTPGVVERPAKPAARYTGKGGSKQLFEVGQRVGCGAIG